MSMGFQDRNMELLLIKTNLKFVKEFERTYLNAKLRDLKKKATTASLRILIGGKNNEGIKKVL